MVIANKMLISLRNILNICFSYLTMRTRRTMEIADKIRAENFLWADKCFTSCYKQNSLQNVHVKLVGILLRCVDHSQPW